MKRMIFVLSLLSTTVMEMCHGAALLMQSGKVPAIEVVTDAARKFGNVDRQLSTLKNFIAQVTVESEQQRSALKRLGSDLQRDKDELERSHDGRRRLFLQKKVAETSHTYQVVSESLQLASQILLELQEHKALLEQLPTDPISKILTEEDRSAPEFDDLRRVGRLAGDLRDQQNNLQRSVKLIATDLEKRQRTLDDANKELLDIEEKQRKFLRSEGPIDDIKDLSRTEQGEILDLQLERAQQNKKLAQLRLLEGQSKKDFFELQLVVIKQKFELVAGAYEKIKRKVRVDLLSVKEAENKLAQDRQELFSRQALLNEEKRVLLPAIEATKEVITNFSNDLSQIVGDLSSAQNWNVDTKKLKSISAWQLIGKGLAQFARYSLLDSKRALIDAQIGGARFVYQAKEREVGVLKTWHWLTRDYKVNLASYIDEATKQYESVKAQLAMESSDLQVSRDAAIEKLYQLNIRRDYLKKILQEFRDDRVESVFERQQEPRRSVQALLVAADEDIRAELAVVTKLVEVLSKSLASVQEQQKGVQDVLAELSARSFWMRSDQSISLQDLKDFFPDIRRFMGHVGTTIQAYSSRASIDYLAQRAWVSLHDLASIAWMVFALLAMLSVFFLLRWILPLVRRIVARINGRGMWIASFGAFSLGFLFDHLLVLYSWGCVGFVILHTWGGRGPQALTFFLVSIPLLLWVVHKFFVLFEKANLEHGSIWISPSYRQRFFTSVPLLAYVSVILSFFRWAFISSNSAFDSQVPEILLAANIIFLQLALISLISKDIFIGQNTVLWFIPRSSLFGRMIEEKIERYYFVFQAMLAAIIVLNNPYVGYGKQMFYILVRVFGTLLIIPLIIWFYDWFKRVSSDMFFHYPDGIVAKERFSSGKMWYGFFVLGSFVAFIVLGFFVVSLVWGHTISVAELSQFMQRELFPAGNDALTGKPIQITVYSIVKVFLYVFGGVLVVYVLNSFVLARIFDPMLVGSGVQNTIMTFSRYMIFVVAFFMGLQSVGLDSLATKLGLVVAGVAYIFKEPIGDFLSYFIILVQRPIKIGDYIKMEDPYQFEGVVRFITPRSTVIRSRNSNVYIIPNTLIITRPVQNWNYSKTFSSTEDILFTVSYDVDPYIVKQLLHEVLSAQTVLLKNPEPVARLTNFVGNGQQFLVRGYISGDRVMDKWDIESDIRLAIVKKLSEHDITVSVPMQIRAK